MNEAAGAGTEVNIKAKVFPILPSSSYIMWNGASTKIEWKNNKTNKDKKKDKHIFVLALLYS